MKKRNLTGMLAGVCISAALLPECLGGESRQKPQKIQRHTAALLPAETAVKQGRM